MVVGQTVFLVECLTMLFKRDFILQHNPLTKSQLVGTLLVAALEIMHSQHKTEGATWIARSALDQKKTLEMRTCVVVLSYLKMFGGCSLKYAVSH